MTRKQVGRNTGNAGRSDCSGAELEKLGVNVDDAVQERTVAHALVDSTDSDALLVSAPA